MAEFIDNLEPLFDYSRVQPFDPQSLDDDDSSPAFPTKQPKLLSVVENKPENGGVIKIIDCEDNEEEDWLSPAPRPKVSIDTHNPILDSTIKALRLKKQELLSYAQLAEHAMRAVEEFVNRDSNTLQASLYSDVEPPLKPSSGSPCERSKIIISIQDRDGLKQLRVYTDDKFERLFKIYADKVKLDMQKLVFCFDGDKIDAAATPEGLEMEDNDIIEVHVKSS